MNHPSSTKRLFTDAKEVYTNGPLTAHAPHPRGPHGNHSPAHDYAGQGRPTTHHPKG